MNFGGFSWKRALGLSAAKARLRGASGYRSRAADGSASSGRSSGGCCLGGGAGERIDQTVRFFRRYRLMAALRLAGGIGRRSDRRQRSLLRLRRRGLRSRRR